MFVKDVHRIVKDSQSVLKYATNADHSVMHIKDVSVLKQKPDKIDVKFIRPKDELEKGQHSGVVKKSK